VLIIIPIISVVIPLYNKEKYVVRTIQSVLQQTVKDFEIIVVDDGSTDSSLREIATISDPRIRVIEQPNGGESAARNTGIKAAKAEFIAFIDADDEWLPSHLGTVLELHFKYPSAGMATDQYEIKTSDGSPRVVNYQAVPKNSPDCLLPNFFESVAKGDSPLNSSSVCIKKSVCLKYGGFPVGEWWGGDMDLFGKIAFDFPIAFSWTLGSIYHWDVENRACTLPSTGQEPFVKTAYAKVSRGEVDNKFQPYVDECIYKKELYRAACMLFCGESLKARKVAMTCQTKLLFNKKCVIVALTYVPSFIANRIVKGILNF